MYACSITTSRVLYSAVCYVIALADMFALASGINLPCILSENVDAQDIADFPIINLALPSQSDFSPYNTWEKRG